MDTLSQDQHIARSDAYRLLAAGFYEPDRELFLEEDLCGRLETLMQKICPEAAPFCRKMAEALATTPQEELATDHAALFVGPFELAAPPYGSIYLEEKRQLMGESTMAVKKFYQRIGIAPREKEAPDHLIFELECMSYLAGCCSGARAEELPPEEAEALQREFLDAFLSGWITPLAEKVRQGSSTGFYPALADCLETFIACELKRLLPGRTQAAA